MNYWVIFFVVLFGACGGAEIQDKLLRFNSRSQKNEISFLSEHCDEDCAKNCVAGSGSLCLQVCGCSSVSIEQGTIFDLAENDKKTKWWINTHSSKAFEFSKCENDCEKFCMSLKGKTENCRNKCSDKFCEEKSYGLMWVFIVSIVVAGLFVLFWVGTAKKSLVHQSAYRRF